MKALTTGRKMAGYLTLSIAAALLSACGGGGDAGSGSSAGPVVSSQAGPVTVVLPTYEGFAYWVAYQDGDGPWRLAQKTSTGFTFQVDDKGGKYAAVVVEEPSSASTVGIAPLVSGYHFTRAEVATIDLRKRLDYAGQGLMSLSYTLSNAPAGGRCAVAAGTRMTFTNSCSTGTLYSVPRQKSDVFASHLNEAGVADALVIQRDLDLVNENSLNLDFSSSVKLGASQTSQLASYSPVTGETLNYMATLSSATGFARLAQGTQTSLGYPLLPTGQQRTGDLYVVSATASLTQGEVMAHRSSDFRSASGTGQALTLPPYANPVAISVAAVTPMVRPTLSWTPVAGSLLSKVYVQALAEDPLSWDFIFSAGWTQGAKATSYTVPDLTSLGWKPSWGLVQGTRYQLYYFNAYTSKPSQDYFVTGIRDRSDDSSWYTRLSSPVSVP